MRCGDRVERDEDGRHRTTSRLRAGAFDISTLDEDDLAIAAVTVAEFRTGIELADSPRRAADRARVLAAITAAITVLDHTEATAAEHGRLLAHAHRAGAPRGAHDLIVAAHAVADARTILSSDAGARFGDLPGVLALAPSSRATFPPLPCAFGAF